MINLPDADPEQEGRMLNFVYIMVTRSRHCKGATTELRAHTTLYKRGPNNGQMRTRPAYESESDQSV